MHFNRYKISNIIFMPPPIFQQLTKIIFTTTLTKYLGPRYALISAK